MSGRTELNRGTPSWSCRELLVGSKASTHLVTRSTGSEAFCVSVAVVWESRRHAGETQEEALGFNLCRKERLTLPSILSNNILNDLNSTF